MFNTKTFDHDTGKEYQENKSLKINAKCRPEKVETFPASNIIIEK